MRTDNYDSDANFDDQIGMVETDPDHGADQGADQGAGTDPDHGADQGADQGAET